jgi:hypothetical protein
VEEILTSKVESKSFDVEAFIKVRVLSTRNNREKGVMSYENSIVPLKVRGNFEFSIDNENH